MEPKYVVKIVIFLLIIGIYVAVKMIKGKARNETVRRGPIARKAMGRTVSPSAQSQQKPVNRTISAVHLALQQWLNDPSYEFPDNVIVSTEQDVMRAVNAISRVVNPVEYTRAEQMLQFVSRIADVDVLLACDEHLVPAMQDLRLRTSPEEGSVIDFCPFDLLVAKWLAAMGTPRAGMELIRLSHEERWVDHWMWSSVFESIPSDGPGALMLAQVFMKKLPTGFCAVALVDYCNRLVSERKDATEHPFDHPEGWERLRGWLSDVDHPSYGLSAAAALPYISPQALTYLLPLAVGHSDRRVQMLAAYTQVKIGDTGGLEVLVKASTEIASSQGAVALLTDLGHEENIPPSVRDPDFQAQTAFADWALHPNEMKKVPDRMHVRFRQELYWPPQDERMEVVLLAYEYDDLFGQGFSEGVALIGPITFALRNPDLHKLDNEDILGLYCAWELTSRHDERRPQMGDEPALFGRHVLASYNPDRNFLRDGESVCPAYDFASGTPGSSFVDSQASRPGRLTLDDGLLALWHGDVFGSESVLDPDDADDLMNPVKLRHSLEQHMLYGDAQPAVVVHVNPTIIAAKTDELDCVVLLWVPQKRVEYFSQFMDLSIGARLVSVNTYYREDVGQKDLMPGPKSLARYAGFWPIIGDFVCSDREALRQIRSAIEESEWQYAQVLAQALIDKRGWMVRTVLPLLSRMSGKLLKLKHLQGK